MKIKSIKNELSLGILILIALMCIIFLSFKLGKFDLNTYNTYICNFENISGLTLDSPVFYRGVKAGKIFNIKTSEEIISLILKIKSKIIIRNDAICPIKSKSILGDNYIDIMPNKLDTPILKNNEIIHTTQELKDISKVLADLSSTLSDTKLLANDLTNILEENRINIKLLINNLENISSNFSERANHIISLVQSDYPEFKKNIITLNNDIDNLLKKIPENLTDTKEILKDFKKVLENIKEFDKETMIKLITDLKEFLKKEGIKTRMF